MGHLPSRFQRSSALFATPPRGSAILFNAVPANAALALAVVALDLSVGTLRGRIPLPPSPPVLVARLTLALSGRLDRPRRGEKALVVRGVLMVVLLAGVAVAAGFGIEVLARGLPGGVILEGLVLWSCLRVSRPLIRLLETGRQLRTASVEPGLARTALEQMAVSFVHFVVVPLFWFVAAGLPGLLLAVACWGLERAAARAVGRSQGFGLAADRLDRIVVWIPQRIAELILAMASAAVPRGHPAIALRQGWAHASSGDFGPIAALAGGLGVALGGPVRHGRKSWVGVGSAQIGRSDIARGVWLYAAALLIVGAILAGLLLTHL